MTFVRGSLKNVVKDLAHKVLMCTTYFGDSQPRGVRGLPYF